MEKMTFLSILKPDPAGISPSGKEKIKNEFYRENFLKLEWCTLSVFICQVLFIIRDYFAGFYLDSQWNYINLGTAITAGSLSLVYYIYIVTHRNKTVSKTSRVLYKIYMALVIVTVCAYMFTDIFVRHADFGVCICFLFIPIIAPCYDFIQQILIFGFVILFSGTTYLICSDMNYLGVLGVILLPLLLCLTSCFLRSYFIMTLISRERTQLLTDELTYRSKTDFLTDVSSRYCLYEDYSSAQNNDVKTGIVMYDIDDFKKFNDEFSHLAGDECLKRTCAVVNAFAKAHKGKVYRFGGEEFIVVFFGIAKNEFEKLAPEINSLIYNMKIKHAKGAMHPYISVSSGSLYVKNPKDSLETVLLKCDRTLYEAKAKGKNCCVMN